MTPLLYGRRHPSTEVWWRVDIHDQRALYLRRARTPAQAGTASWRSPERRPRALPPRRLGPEWPRRCSRERGAPTNYDLKQEADRTTGCQGSERYACTTAMFADL